MYGRSAKYYDKIYSWKDYRKESDKIHRHIRKYKKSQGRDLLDVACGTGNHLPFLKKWYRVEGLDNSIEMLGQAQKKFPGIRFYKADMTRFRLKKKYDVVTCLFSAIGHVKGARQLAQAIRVMGLHLKPGGVMVLEPSFDPKKWQVGRMHAIFVNEPKLKIARMNVSERRGNFAVLNMHHLIATPKGVEHFVESEEMSMFSKDEYDRAFEQVNLGFVYDKYGLEGRGLYLGLRPVE